ncbi:hypothetical protein [Pseudomonas koreensis]|uniref:hypothetical protein n=1 Tax=Pseudomonas koreensis TaxID=198620 RepID=UPI001B32775E|nr:hypothetical protein [Pseudomonas koreensis]MBP3999913.1 hypothetical protein [Pseudomonas koreensis]
MRRLLIAALAGSMLAGCSTSPISADKAKQVPAERVIANHKPISNGAVLAITRDTGWFAGGGCYAGILVDGRLAARIGTGETVRLFVQPGRHIVGISGDPDGSGLCGMQIGQPVKESASELKAGEIQKFRISGDTNGGLDLRPTSL